MWFLERFFKFFDFAQITYFSGSAVKIHGNTWNPSFGQNRKNRKIALKTTKIIGYFFLDPFWKLWGISDVLERFWGQKFFSIVFKIAYYVNIGFSSIFFEQNLLETWPLARSGCPKIAKISKIGFFAKTCLWSPLHTINAIWKCLG